jgi:hypothetical protein
MMVELTGVLAGDLCLFGEFCEFVVFGFWMADIQIEGVTTYLHPKITHRIKENTSTA